MNARERAVEVMGQATVGHGGWEYRYARSGMEIIGAECECGFVLSTDDRSPHAEFAAHVDGLRLDALLSSSVSDCETCGGTGKLRHRFGTGARGGPCEAPDCIDGKVTRPALAVLREDMEQVGWRIDNEDDDPDYIDGRPAGVRDTVGRNADGTWIYEAAGEPLYRLKESS